MLLLASTSRSVAISGMVHARAARDKRPLASPAELENHCRLAEDGPVLRLWLEPRRAPDARALSVVAAPVPRPAARPQPRFHVLLDALEGRSGGRRAVLRGDRLRERGLGRRLPARRRGARAPRPLRDRLRPRADRGGRRSRARTPGAVVQRAQQGPLRAVG